MQRKVLVTGGAGFIGSHLVDTLVNEGHHVRVYDNLEPQVHGVDQKQPQYLNQEAQYVWGDIRDRESLRKAFEDIEVVFHKAAAVGVGQSMYEIRKYVEVNTLGGANLLDILAKEKHKVQKVIVASSMSIYGEGKYTCEDCGDVFPQLRPQQQLENRDWEMKCPTCGKNVKPVSTDEDKPLYPTSIYAITKRDHEEMFLSVGRAYNIPTVALRYFNVYGPRQALSNPYTGVLAIFSGRILNKHAPVIFEDGLQSRDFIHVSDIVRANLLAMKNDEANYGVFNVGTGQPRTVLEIANVLIDKLGFDGKPEIVNKFRAGDIRHCYADISKIRDKLGFVPNVKFDDGITNLLVWLKTQAAEDSFDESRNELEAKGLII